MKVKAAKLKDLKLRHLDLDPLENLFSLVRQCGGSSTDLTCGQFTAALKTCLITRFATLVKDKNCLDDHSHLMADLRVLLETADEEQNPVVPSCGESVFRGDTPAPVNLKPVSSGQSLLSQAPALLWASALGSALNDVECMACLNLLTSNSKTVDTTCADFVGAFGVYPSPNLISLFMKLQSIFDNKWKRLLY